MRVDDGVHALDGAGDGGPVADIGLDQLDLADIARHLEIDAQMGPPHGDAHPPALLAERADHAPAEEARSAEYGYDLAGHGPSSKAVFVCWLARSGLSVG